MIFLIFYDVRQFYGLLFYLNNMSTIDQILESTNMYYKDNRQPNQIQLTNQLARALSQLNLHRIEQKHINQRESKSIRKEDFLYVCIHGNPPFQNQFQSLSLPGQCIYFMLQSNEKGKSEEELLTMPTQFQKQATLLQQRIEQASKHKPLVFIYHSYGTYIFAAYCQLFPHNRIIGIIDIGGAPIRFYPMLKGLKKIYEEMTLDEVKSNLDHLYQLSLQRSKKIGLAPHKNKYQLLGLVRSFKEGFAFKEMFKFVRNLPKVLKCFIYGRKDHIFPEDMINQKIVYYSYQNDLDPSYESKLSQIYKEWYGCKAERIQQRFIFSFQGGYHSIHMQKKYKQIIKKIVENYLQFLEQQGGNNPNL